MHLRSYWDRKSKCKDEFAQIKIQKIPKEVVTFVKKEAHYKYKWMMLICNQKRREKKKIMHRCVPPPPGGGGGLPIRENLSVNIPLWLSNFMSSQDH